MEIALNNYYAFLLVPFLAWIIGLYFLKSRPRTRRLPSTFLWQKVLLKKNESALWQKFRGSFFLLIQIVALVFAIGSLLQPTGKGGISGEVVFVIDNSFSMKATDLSETRLEIAKKRAHDVSTFIQKTANVSLYTVSDSMNLIYSGDGTLNRIISEIDGIKETCLPGPDHELIAHTVLSATKQKATVFLLGDSFDTHFYEKRLSGRIVKVIHIGEQNLNCAITELDVSKSSQGYVVSVKVRNFGAVPVKGELVLKGEHGYSQSLELSLFAPVPGEKSEKLAIFSPFSLDTLPSGFVVSLVRKNGEQDILPDDDSARFVLSSEKINVVCINGGESLKRIFELNPSIETTFLTSAEFSRWKSEKKEAHLFVSSGYLDQWLEDKPLILFHPERSSSFTTGDTVTSPRPYRGEVTHPVMHYLTFPGLTIDESVILKDTPQSTPLVLCEKGPVVSAFSQNGFRQVVAGFPLEKASLSTDVPFPVFIVNCLKWILGSDLKEARAYRTGDVLLLNTSNPQHKISVAYWKDYSQNSPKMIEVSVKDSKAHFFKSPGFYKGMVFEESYNGKKDVPIVYGVSVLNERESSLEETMSIVHSPLKQVVSGKRSRDEQYNGKEYYPIFSGLFLAVVMIEWILFSVKGG